MVTSKQALNKTIEILKQYLSDVSGDTGDSHIYGFYQISQNCLYQITPTVFVKFRVADHGLYMQTFVTHNNGVPPELVNIISIVYRETPKETIGTKWRTNGYPNNIVAFQYVYPCWEMNIGDVNSIAMELLSFAKTGIFIPPYLCTKEVKAQEIISDVGIRDITNKLRAYYCSIHESIKNKTNMNMKKNIVKLNESQLRRIVAESVKRALNEISTRTLTNAYQKTMTGYNGQNDNVQRKPRQHQRFEDEINARYKEQFMDDNGYFNDMHEDDIRKTEAYRIAYDTLDNYCVEGDWEQYGIDEKETCADIKYYTRIPDEIIYLALRDWEQENPEIEAH